VTSSRPQTTELDPGTVDVLVVDDDKELRESLLELIQQWGFVAIAAGDGAEALRLVSNRRPRLVLLDLEMPVMNGWQFLERRRSDRRLAETPVIIMSARRNELARRGDVQDRLEKPLEEPALLATLNAILSGASVDPARPLPDSDAPATILVIEDDADTQASVVELLEDHGYRVIRANNGEEAEALLRKGRRPDCIVLDLWMPVMNGWSFTAQLPQFGGPPIPIVVMTAAEPHWGYPVPVAQVMRKPLRPEALLALIRKVAPATTPAQQLTDGARSKAHPHRT
jgi:CheY-like chemotaxis protein